MLQFKEMKNTTQKHRICSPRKDTIMYYREKLKICSLLLTLEHTHRQTHKKSLTFDDHGNIITSSKMVRENSDTIKERAFPKVMFFVLYIEVTVLKIIHISITSLTVLIRYYKN